MQHLALILALVPPSATGTPEPAAVPIRPSATLPVGSSGPQDPGTRTRPVRQISEAERNALYDGLSSENRVTPVVRVVDAVGPSTVYIETEVSQRVHQWPFGARDVNTRGGGTGAVVHEDGFIVTNYHVVRGAHAIQVSFADDLTPYPADLLSYKESEDLALLRIRLSPERRAERLALTGSTDSDQPRFPAVRMGQSRDLMTGEQVIAIGNPHGQAHTVSTGIVSGQHREVRVQNLVFRDLIQTDASINLGNSGGPLLNVRGELIGINTVMNTAAENIGFAIPVDRVREVLREELFPNARTSWVGLELEPGEPLRVRRVWPGGPADLADICEGDVLVAIGERAVTDRQTYLDATLELQPMRAVPFTVRRGERNTPARVVPWDRLDGLLYEHIGLVAREARISRDTYLIVEGVAADGPADQLGLRRGDLIPAVRPHTAGVLRPLRIRDRRDLAGVIENLEAGTRISVDVYRDANENGEYERDELLKGDFRLR